MQVVPFIADSAADAVTQIRSQLGSDAVVVNVRQLPAGGIARLWKSPRIEVLAYKPGAKVEANPEELAELREQLEHIKQRINSGAQEADRRHGTSEAMPAPGVESPDAPTSLVPGTPNSRPANPAGTVPGGWRAGTLLAQSGLMPGPVEQVMEVLRRQHGENAPASLAEELVLARAALKSLWPNGTSTGAEDFRPQLFIGPAGVGKTTCLCKWLAQVRLIEGRTARVWRLDGTVANTAESLSVYGDILGVPVERTWSAKDAASGSSPALIDMPGIDWRNEAALRELGRQIEDLGPCRVHLVLNAAYDLPLLMAQARAFANLPVEDLVFTHLDEEPRWGKLWNVLWGIKLPVRFFSAGQNIPGEFFPATAEKIFSRQFPA